MAKDTGPAARLYTDDRMRGRAPRCSGCRRRPRSCGEAATVLFAALPRRAARRRRKRDAVRIEPGGASGENAAESFSNTRPSFALTTLTVF